MWHLRQPFHVGVHCALIVTMLMACQPTSDADTANLQVRLEQLTQENDSLRSVIGALHSAAELNSPRKSTSARVLGRIEAFRAPPLPEGADAESWDRLVRGGAMGMPTKELALVRDVCVLIKNYVDPDLVPHRASQGDVAVALRRYENRDEAWERSGGFRPWTHSHFVRVLTPPDRVQLGREITTLLQSGVVADWEC